jgi:glycosyltransferase involved in cell wall biosynthesis
MSIKTKKNHALVTVYITNFNYANYIEKSIQSVLNQTYKNFELIIIDDGSTDNSKSIINKYLENPKVRIIFQKNKGLNQTNNVAVKSSNGEFVMRLDADDYLDENALLVMVRTIQRSKKLGLVFSNYYYVDKNENITGQELRFDFKKEVELLNQPAHGACSLIRKSALLEIGAYSNEFSCQDGWDLWLKIIENYDVENVKLPLFYYRRHEKNLTNNQEKLLETRSRIYEKHAERINRPDLKVISVIPIRGKKIEKNSELLNLLGDKPLINWTLDNVLNSKVTETIVTTPDQELIDYLDNNYGKKITLVKRDLQDALENTSYKPAIIDSLKKKKSSNYDAVLELTPDAPFRSSLYINKAINVMRVHRVDRVLGVTEDDAIFYNSTGKGLKPIGNINNSYLLRFERDYLYRQAGGISLLSKYCIENQTDFKDYKNGHIILTVKSALRVRNKFEMKLAKLMMEEIK